MSNQTGPRLAKWPFFLGDLVLLGMAIYIWADNKQPLGQWQTWAIVLCGAVGAIIALVPFMVEYWAAVRLVETSGLVATVEEIRHLELIALQISSATAQWQVVQEYSSNTVTAAKEITDRMSGEVAAFTEFLQKANDSEKANLRLEVDKLRRMENDWLAIIMRLLDHTYALYRAAERSGQTALIEQLSLFQNSCRDVARRIGLVPFMPAPGELFDPKSHQSADSQADSMTEAHIQDVVATGFTYQGRLVRQALVALKNPAPAADEAEPAAPEDEPKSSKDALEEQTLL